VLKIKVEGEIIGVKFPYFKQFSTLSLMQTIKNQCCFFSHRAFRIESIINVSNSLFQCVGDCKGIDRRYCILVLNSNSYESTGVEEVR